MHHSNTYWYSATSWLADSLPLSNTESGKCKILLNLGILRYTVINTVVSSLCCTVLALIRGIGIERVVKGSKFALLVLHTLQTTLLHICPWNRFVTMLVLFSM